MEELIGLLESFGAIGLLAYVMYWLMNKWEKKLERLFKCNVQQSKYLKTLNHNSKKQTETLENINYTLLQIKNK